MVTGWKSSGKASSVPAGLAMGAAVSMMMTLGMCAGIAFCLSSEKMTWQQAGYWIMGILFAASFAGGKCAFAAIKRRRFAVSAMSGALYWGLLLCLTALFFGGNYDAVPETAGLIGAGSVCSALIIPGSGRKNGRKRGGYYR